MISKLSKGKFMHQSAYEQLTSRLRKEKYQLIGTHSAVKKCRWLHQSLVYNRPCYKQKFYGIQSHRCIQLTPAILNCTMRCLFCWRIQPSDIDLKINETEMPETDDPALIVEECLRAQKRILSGYKAHKEISKEKYKEALDTKHAAISLAGEPTLYPRLNDLIYEFSKRNITTFLVTNGTMPRALSRLSNEPTQLYISVCAPDEEVFKRVCRPQIPNAWQRLNESLELLKSFKCATALRLTLVRNLNMLKPEGYAALIEKASSTYVEAKSYMHVGFSRKRLDFSNMPVYEEILDFSKKISNLSSYNIINQSVESRVVLLSGLKKPRGLASS
jgi:tRNA wybutosine-synthesizing protein 1